MLKLFYHIHNPLPVKSLNALNAALSFFSTLPVGEGYEEYDTLRKNLHVIPLAGTVIGILIASITFFISLFAPGLTFLGVLIYLAFEGINHIDGLADVGDAILAPKHRRREVLKDVRVGAGGVVFVVVYLFLLFESFRLLGNSADLIVAVILSQTSAKFSMLFLITTSKPLWEGMASSIMEYASRTHLIKGFSFLITIYVLLAIFSGNVVIITAHLATSLFTILLIRGIAHNLFGGVNGDIFGASNCIIFALGMLVFVAG
jgi:adenosylcobinamide-GDP ribazoletransferase